jgi:DNA transposition AAA+ family ATPase
MINRSASLVYQYINKTYRGDITQIEKDITNLLRRKEAPGFAVKSDVFYKTNIAKLIWEVLCFCDEKHVMGVVVSPSGLLKTSVSEEFQNQNRGTILLTVDITTRAVGSVLRMIASKVSCTPHGIGSNSALLYAIIERLKDSNRLILVDECHLCEWGGFEVLRRIHDTAGIGIVFLGQERTLDQMRGSTKRSFLFEQIYSRIVIRRHLTTIEKSDIRLIADSLCPGLPQDCLEFLHKRASEPGRFRNIANLLNWAVQINKEQKIPIDLDLLKDVNKFLVI